MCKKREMWFSWLSEHLGHVPHNCNASARALKILSVWFLIEAKVGWWWKSPARQTWAAAQIWLEAARPIWETAQTHKRPQEKTQKCKILFCKCIMCEYIDMSYLFNFVHNPVHEYYIPLYCFRFAPTVKWPSKYLTSKYCHWSVVGEDYHHVVDASREEGLRVPVIWLIRGRTTFNRL